MLQETKLPWETVNCNNKILLKINNKNYEKKKHLNQQMILAVPAKFSKWNSYYPSIEKMVSSTYHAMWWHQNVLEGIPLLPGPIA